MYVSTEVLDALYKALDVAEDQGEITGAEKIAARNVLDDLAAVEPSE